MKKNNKIKILFLDHTPFVGGAQLSLVQHLANIDYSKFEIFLVCSEQVDEQLEIEYRKLPLIYKKIALGRLKKFSFNSLVNLFKSIFLLIKLINKEKIDLVASITVRTCIVGSIAAFFSRRPSVWLIRDFTFNRFLFKFLSYLPKKIIYNSFSVAGYYCRNFKMDKKHSVVYVGRDFYKKAEKVTAEQIKTQRTGWGAGEQTLVVGYAGRLVGWKGAQILIYAIKNLIIEKNIRNIKLIISGTGAGQSGNNESALKNFVEENKLTEFIIFLGQQKNLAAIMKAMDILVLPSLEPEPFSSVVVDAMMAKIAVIGTNIGGTPEIIKDTQTGLLVKPNDVQSLSAAIEQLMLDNNLRSRIVNNAYDTVMKNYTAKEISGKLEQIYLSALLNK